jgi:hypothetical protein
LLRDTRFKESVKLLVESSEERYLRCDGEEQRQIISVLITELIRFAHNQILMLPDKGRLFLLAHATPPLSLLLGALAGPTPAFLTPFVALAFDPVFDRPHPIKNQFVYLLDDMENAQLMLQALPVAL